MSLSTGIKSFAKIAASSFAGWLKIVLPGGIFSLVCIITALSLMLKSNGHSDVAAHAGTTTISTFLLTKFWSCLLLLGSVGGVFIYLSIAHKYALQRALQLIWQNNLADEVTAKTGVYIKRLTDKSPGWLGKLDNAAMVKLKLLDATANDPELGRIQKSVLRWGLKKLTSDDINLKSGESALAVVIPEKMKLMIANVVSPSMQSFRITFIVQALLLVVAVYFN